MGHRKLCEVAMRQRASSLASLLQASLDEAAKANIELKEYSVVYDALDEIKAMMDKLIRPPPSKQLGSIVGTADVLQTFKIADVGKVAGCRLLDGLLALDVGLFQSFAQFFGAARRRVGAAPLERRALARADAGVRLGDGRGPVCVTVRVLLSGVVSLGAASL